VTGTTSNPPTHTFRDIDRALDLAKGRAFRAFKVIRQSLREGSDFVLLHHRDDAALIRELRRQGRIYAASVNAVLLSDDARRRVVEQLRRDG